MSTFRIAALAAATLLTGCAAMNRVDSEVMSFGEWPAGRAPGTYAIERLPSQQARGPQQASLEGAARNALEQAGFKPAADAAGADVVVQLGARITRTDFSPWDDPFWWRWGPGYWRRPGWRTGWAWPPHYESVYDREVGVLIRDRKSGTPLYEARASNDSNVMGDMATLSAMFQAALKDFPNAVPTPHRIAVQLDAAADSKP